MKHVLKNAVFLLKYALKKCSFLFATTTVRYTFAAIIPMINVVGIGIVVDALLSQKSRGDLLSTVLTYVLFQLSISLLTEVFAFIDNIAVRKASDITQKDYMRDAVFINYHYAQDGSILDLKKKSMKAHPIWLLRDIGILLKYVIQFLGITYLFASTSPWFILIIIITSTISIALSLKKQKLDFEFQNAQVTENRKLDYLYKTMSDYKYAKEIRINQANSFIQEKFKNILLDQMKKLKQFMKRSVGFETIQVSIVVLQTALTYLFFTYQVSLGEISIAEYTVLLGATTLLTSILLGFFEHLGKIKITLDYTDLFRKYREHVEINSNILLNNAFKTLIQTTEAPRITFENVSFSYPEQEKVILKNINFEISAGQKIGIVGLNGSGKTTLIKLLCRLYEPTEGRILVNGIDIKTVPYDEYSKIVSIVFQDFFLFAYSVQENIIFNKEHDDEKLKKSIQESGLEQKIVSLPKGLDTPVYKKLDSYGVEFSGGEGQELALARAIYKNAKILILDEPTSALDPIAEYELFSRLYDFSEEKTTLFVSHRLSSTAFCDNIIVISNGIIAEKGTHSELMQQNGIYAQLYRSQAKYYETEVK